MFDDSYMPKLIDIIGWQNSEDERTKTYYGKFGFRQLVVPSDCPNVSERFGTLCDLAEGRYAFREINRETMEQWQISLQSRFDAVVHTFEHSYAMQKKWQSVIDESLTKATEILHSESKEDTKSDTRTDTSSESNETNRTDSREDSSTTSGTDSRTENKSETSKKTFVDTPDSAVNETLQYADSIEKTESTGEGTSSGSTSGTSSGTSSGSSKDTSTGTSSGSSTGSSKGTSSGSATDILTDYRNLQSEMDKIIDGYRDIDILFVSKFENNFLNVFY